MTTKTTTQGVTTSTPVSICIGSDQYAAKVLRVTAQTITAEMRDDRPMTFRRNSADVWKSGNFRLYIGKSETRLDPHF